MDVHQKLVAGALGLVAFTIVAEYYWQQQLMWKWYWHPIGILVYNKWIPYEPAVPSIIALLLLISTLFIKGEAK